MNKQTYKRHLKQALTKQGADIGFTVLEDSSTNIYADTHLPSRFPFLVAAISQKDGKGRLGRAFVSDKGGAYFTLQLLADKDFTPEKYTLAAGVGAAMALCGLPIGLKWPNDIFIEGKKLGGILCAGKPTANGTLINCGIGINVTNDVSLIGAARLADYLPEEDIFTLIAKITVTFLDLLNKTQDEILAHYKSYSIMPGKRIKVAAGEESFTATAVDIGPSGNLIAEKDGEQISLSAGDVSIIWDT
ncbi:MAG: biotin--[acetyl-CoA-carboxylase] ligase [Christensenellales bacterium]|jgi:BirA family biotin operon repressor/biotin-[acetyl-CoA-carboxylase] ligase